MAVADASVRPISYTRTRARWEQLAEAVLRFDPTAIVLVARKAPRVVQALELELGHRPLVVTDTGLEFVADLLKGARVAIVDDIVNVGSTLAHARSLVEAAGAADIGVFALARRASGATPPAVHLVEERPLDDASSELLAAEVPTLLQSQALPYDLDFPVIRSHINVHGDPFETVYASLSAQLGDDSVYDISTTSGASQHIRRLGITLPTAATPHRKVRLYINQVTAECNVVPMCLSSPLRVDRPEHSWAQTIWDMLGAGGRSVRARAHLNFFLESLRLGTSFVADQRELLAPADQPFDSDQASLVFGPEIHRAVEVVPPWDAQVRLAFDVASAAAPSPFLDAAQSHGLIDAVGEALGHEPDALTAFITFINVLADWVGANDPTRYRLNWPYPAAQIAAEPYWRLRIGPTFGDLAAIIARLTDKPVGDAAAIVARLLDHYIDNGGVVPTTACYDQQLYRVYRKGEKDPRDEVALRLRRAWEEYGKPLSLTRASKLAAILAFSEDRGSSSIAVKTQSRGNVACYSSSVLDEETEITHQLRRTGQLRRADTT